MSRSRSVRRHRRTRITSSTMESSAPEPNTSSWAPAFQAAPIAETVPSRSTYGAFFAPAVDETLTSVSSTYSARTAATFRLAAQCHVTPTPRSPISTRAAMSIRPGRRPPLDVDHLFQTAVSSSWLLLDHASKFIRRQVPAIVVISTSAINTIVIISQRNHRQNRMLCFRSATR